MNDGNCGPTGNETASRVLVTFKGLRLLRAQSGNGNLADDAATDGGNLCDHRIPLLR